MRKRIDAHDGRDFRGGRNIFAQVGIALGNVSIDGRKDQGVGKSPPRQPELGLGIGYICARRHHRRIVLARQRESRFILFLQLIALGLLLIVSGRARRLPIRSISLRGAGSFRPAPKPLEHWRLPEPGSDRMPGRVANRPFSSACRNAAFACSTCACACSTRSFESTSSRRTIICPRLT